MVRTHSVAIKLMLDCDVVYKCTVCMVSWIGRKLGAYYGLSWVQIFEFALGWVGLGWVGSVR